MSRTAALLAGLGTALVTGLPVAIVLTTLWTPEGPCDGFTSMAHRCHAPQVAGAPFPFPDIDDGIAAT